MKITAVLFVLLAVSPVLAQPSSASAQANSASRAIQPGAKIYIEPMDGFDTYLAAAFMKKKVPVIIVGDQSKADFVITGNSKEEKAGWAKTIFVSPRPHAEASITVKNVATGEIVYAYNVDKSSAARADQSTAEACAKHFKHFIEKGN